MEHNTKNKAHRSCSCDQCTRGKATKAGQAIHKANERKLRRQTKLELDKAVKDAQLELDLDEVDVLSRINSPYTD